MYLLDYFSLILEIAEGDMISDPQVQKVALEVIINCMCGPMEQVFNGNDSDYYFYTQSLSITLLI